MSRTNKKKKTGGKAHSARCQNNNSCNYCKDNRTYKNQKADQASKDKLKE